MILLLDHDIPVEVAQVLRREGHQAHRLVDQLPITCKKRHPAMSRPLPGFCQGGDEGNGLFLDFY
jgi:hypothetical protein